MESDFSNLKNAQRKELIDELISLSKEHFVHLFKNIFEDTVKNNVYPEMLLREFQDNLSKTKNWDNSKINDISNSFPDILPLMNNIFILNRQLFPNESELITEIDLDNKERFIKYTCLNIAREMWKKPFLFHEISKQLNYCNNDEYLDKIVTNCIKTYIRRQSNLLNVQGLSSNIQNEEIANSEKNNNDESTESINNKLADSLNIHDNNVTSNTNENNIEIVKDHNISDEANKNNTVTENNNETNDNPEINNSNLSSSSNHEDSSKKNENSNETIHHSNDINVNNSNKEDMKRNQEYDKKNKNDNVVTSHHYDKDNRKILQELSDVEQTPHIETALIDEDKNDKGSKLDIFNNYIPFSNNMSRDSNISSISSFSSNPSESNKSNRLLHKKLNKLILKQQKKKQKQSKQKRYMNKLIKKLSSNRSKKTK